MTKQKDAGQKSKIVEMLEYYAGLSVEDLRKSFGIRQPLSEGESNREWELSNNQIYTLKRILTRIASDY